MPQLHLPWLELTVLLPLAGAVWTSQIKNRERARIAATIICFLTLIFACSEWLDFALLETFEAHDHWDIFQWLFQRDVLVVDELSAPLFPLGALLYLTTVMTTLRTKVNRFSFGWTLFSESVLMATLASRSPWLIIALLTLATAPPWIELRKRGRSTRVYTLHMALSCGLLIAGQWLAGANASAADPPMLAGGLLTAGALVRSGICPLHCWLTDLFEKATFGAALLLVTPMTGAYAVMRLVFPIAPAWALQSIAILSLVTAVYAAGMAHVQKDSRRFFGYLFLSHSSLVLVGLELATPIGLAGALCVWLSVGISMLGFGLALRSVEARLGHVPLDRHHGLYGQTPFLAGMFLLTGLASIGFPGTIGFIGTELLIEGAVGVYPLVGFAVVLAAALNSVAVVKAYFRVFTGPQRDTSIPMGCRPAERVTILVMVLLILGGGLLPQPGVQSRYHAARALLDHRHPEPELSESSESSESSELSESSGSLAPAPSPGSPVPSPSPIKRRDHETD